MMRRAVVLLQLSSVLSGVERSETVQISISL